MEVWDILAFQSPEQFVRTVMMFRNNTPLLFKIRRSALDEELIKKHKRVFRWQHNDSQMSYREDKKYSVRGKETLTYLRRARSQFHYDQIHEQLKDRQRLISMWDPTKKSDKYGYPCLATLRFIPDGKYLDLVVTFRKRDILRRLIGNVVMLLEWLDEAAKKTRKKPRYLIDFSMEASYRQEDLEKWRRTF